jgi:hypothetical protein
MPGVGYRYYIPKNNKVLGEYRGVVSEFVVYARAKAPDSKTWKGPSRLKTYGNVSLMKSSIEENNDLFMCNFGLNLSFEGNIKRKWLIPFFGIEIGGVFRRGYNTFQFTPLSGIHIVSTKKILWNIQAGYQYNAKYFDQYSGYNITSTINFLLWNN